MQRRPDDASFWPTISDDGRWVTFVTYANDILPGMTLPTTLLRDRCVSPGEPVPTCSPTTECVSLRHDGGQPSGGTRTSRMIITPNDAADLVIHAADERDQR
jgi:hypothetical protein